MKLRPILAILLFLVYSLVSGWYYVCKIKNKCASSNSTINQTNESAIGYNYGTADAVLGENIESFRQDIIVRMGESNVLKIVGLYGPSEQNNTSFENLGIARAVHAQSLFSELDQSRFMLTSKEQALNNGDKQVEALEFYILTKNEFVEETDFGAVLHFEDGDVNMDLNPKLEAYLTYLSMEKKGNMIDVIGHTDDVGSEGENFRLGQQRASRIRELLIEKGLDLNNINATSKGQSEPIADNGTEEGRAANRRVEILIN